jgi:hypothetical protein
MSLLSRRTTVPLAIVLAIASATLLAGCVNPVEAFVKGATKGQVDLSGQRVPADFPTSVPLYDGHVTSGVSMGQDDDHIWNVIVMVPGPQVLQRIADQLTAAGFTTDVDATITKDTTGLIYENAKYDVAVVLKHTSNGYTADYAVTNVPAGG